MAEAVTIDNRWPVTALLLLTAGGGPPTKKVRLLSPGQNRRCDLCPRDKTGDKTVLSHCVKDKTVLSRQYVLRAHKEQDHDCLNVLADTLDFFFD